MFAVAVFALPILIADWHSRKIPNIYLIYIAYGVALMRINSGIASIPVIALAMLLAGAAVVVLRMGIGDAKLFITISLALNVASLPQLLSLLYWIYLATLVQIALTRCSIRCMPGSIPLAFSIIFGTTLYLAAGSTASLPEYADALVNSW